MNDPRIDPAGSPGPESGTNPPTSGGQRPSRHGLFRHKNSGQQSGEPGATGPGTTGPGTTGPGTSGPGTSGPGTPGSGAGAGASATGTAGTTTATRTTSAAGATVPAQAEAPSARTPYGQEYDQGYEVGPSAEPSASMIAKAANMSMIALLLGGLGMIAVGIALLVWPSASLTVVAILIGAAILASGLVRLWEGISAHGESGGMRAGYIVIGLLAVIAGLYCLRHHALSLFLVAFVTGVYFVMHGVADLAVSFSPGVPNRALRGILGVFSIAAGIILVVWPAITLVLLLTIMAAWLLFYGCVLIALAFGVRRAAKAASRPVANTTMAMPAGAA
jgi:uncharacterized membrane protein HdeD (DUF308 family)